MTLLPTPAGSADFSFAGNTISAILSDFTVTKQINEYFKSDMRIDFTYNQWIEDYESFSIDIANTINLYANIDGGTVWTRLFSGKVGPVKKKIDGQTPRWYDIEARGWGEILSQKNFSGYTVDTIHNIIDWIVEDLVPGTLTTNHVATGPSSSITIDQFDVYKIDALKDVCDRNDWMFFVDDDRDLWAFPIGQHSLDASNFNQKLYNLEYSKDPDRIINLQKVVGAIV